MARVQKVVQEVAGQGDVRFSGYEGPARFITQGDLSLLRAASGTLRGVLLLAPALAKAAFQAGQAQLSVASGQSYRLTFLGHTQGDDRTYFEMRI